MHGTTILLTLRTLLPIAAQVEAPPKAAADEAREQRLAEDRARYEALVKAVDQFGHVDEFAAAARKLLAGPKSQDRFIHVSDGSVTDIALEQFLEWNVAPDGGTTIGALDFSPGQHPFDAIVDFNQQLHQHGIDFLLVIFPTRMHCYPELVADLKDMTGFAGMVPGTSRFALELAKAGVETLYLAPEFVAARYGEKGDASDQLFLRDNQHWTPRAAELAAKCVADRIARFSWFQHGAAKEGVDYAVKPANVNVQIVYGGAPEWAKPEKFHANSVRHLDGRLPSSVLPSSPIVLLSDSFADFHKTDGCDFTAQLYRFTGWPLDLINPRGGVEAAARDALRRRNDDLKNEKLVVWLLAEQVFKKSKEWKLIPMFGAASGK